MKNSLYRLKLKDRSTEGKFAYIFEHISIGGVWGVALYFGLPLLFPFAYDEQSVVKCILCMLLTSIIGILFTYTNNRTTIGTGIDVLSGMALYIVFTVGPYVPIVTNIIICITVVFSVFGITMVVFNKIKTGYKIKKVIFISVYKGVLIFRRNMGIAAILVIVLIPISLKMTSEKSINDIYYQRIGYKNDVTVFDEDDYKVNCMYGDEYRLKKNIDLIKLIRYDSTWQELDYKKKCKVIKAICYCEARYLGLSCDLKVEFKDDMRDTTNGEYNHTNTTLYINANHLKNSNMEGSKADEILNTCLHECRHCYQHLLSEAYVKLSPEQRNLVAFNGVDDWIKNMNEYNIPDNSFEAVIKYYYQPLEEDARQYAEKNVSIYHEEIDNILKENKT